MNRLFIDEIIIDTVIEEIETVLYPTTMTKLSGYDMYYAILFSKDELKDELNKIDEFEGDDESYNELNKNLILKVKDLGYEKIENIIEELELEKHVSKSIYKSIKETLIEDWEYAIELMLGGI